MEKITALIPKRYRHVAKAWIAALGVILSAIIVSIPEVPQWAIILTSILTVLGVYEVPNENGGDYA